MKAAATGAMEPAGMPQALCAWYEREKRDLPWRHTHDPYAIWVSEIMLQQTRVETAVPYYQAFIGKWPGLEALADAQEQDVLKAWEGLGYYSRARNLLYGARYVMENHGGTLPCDIAALKNVPGIGPYTAGAIMSIAYDEPAPAVDANALRVFARLCAVDTPVNSPQARRKIEAKVEDALQGCSPRVFNQAVMELGALVCVPNAPRCGACPVGGYCRAYIAGRTGSLPKKSPPPPKRIVHLAVAVVRENGGDVLVRRRDGKGLLHGLWEFPNWEVCGGDPQATVSDALQRLSVPVDGIRAGGGSRHVFTHLIWEMQGIIISAKKAALPDDYAWIKPEELDRLAWSSSMKHWRKSINTMTEQEHTEYR